MKKIFAIISIVVLIIFIFYNSNISREKELLIDSIEEVKYSDKKLNLLSRIKNENIMFLENIQINNKPNTENRDLYESFKNYYGGFNYNKVKELEGIIEKFDIIKPMVNNVFEKLDLNIEEKIKEEHKTIIDKIND